MANTNNNATCPSKVRFGIRCSPLIQDPKEFNTILVSSLRSLFGEIECYSANINLSTVDNTEKKDYQFIIECDSQSASAIRASLTFATGPSYLARNIYRFDTIWLDE